VRERIDHAAADRVFADDLVEARRVIAEKTLVRESLRAAASHGIYLDGADEADFGNF